MLEKWYQRATPQVIHPEVSELAARALKEINKGGRASIPNTSSPSESSERTKFWQHKIVKDRCNMITITKPDYEVG
jgi:hypothetical protein